MNIIMCRLDLGGSAISRSDSTSRFFYVLELLSILVLLHDDPDILRRPCVCHFRCLQLMSSCYSCSIQNLFSRYQTPSWDRKFKQIFLNNNSSLSCDFNFKANKCLFCHVIRFLKLLNLPPSELINLNSLTEQHFVYKNQSINFSRKVKFSNYGGIVEGLPGVI